jgi:hypothetical protein
MEYSSFNKRKSFHHTRIPRARFNVNQYCCIVQNVDCTLARSCSQNNRGFESYHPYHWSGLRNWSTAILYSKGSQLNFGTVTGYFGIFPAFTQCILMNPCLFTIHDDLAVLLKLYILSVIEIVPSANKKIDHFSHFLEFRILAVLVWWCGFVCM